MRFLSRLGALIVATTLVCGPQVCSAQEAEGRPDIAARRAAGDEARQADDRRDEGKSADERRVEDEHAVTAVDEVSRQTDITKHNNAEFHDLSVLSREMDVEKQTGDKTWQTAQAEHAWQGRADTEFRKHGIESREQLQKRANDIREHPDIGPIELKNGRVAYGKFFSGGEKSGMIIIDNPRAENGGTIMTNEDITKGLRRVEKNDSSGVTR